MKIAIPPSRRAVLRFGLVGVSSLASAVWLVAAPAPAHAADAATFETAAALFQQAVAGDEDAVDGAARQFATLATAHPGDPVLLAYAGASTALRATTTMLPWKKMAFADEGLARIDKALSLITPAHDAPAHRGTPASLEARFVAANTFLGMPSLFNRHARGARLLEEVLSSPLLAASPLPFRGAVWLRAGTAAVADKRTADARRWFDQVIASGAPQSTTAQAKLKELAS